MLTLRSACFSLASFLSLAVGADQILADVVVKSAEIAKGHYTYTLTNEDLAHGKWNRDVANRRNMDRAGDSSAQYVTAQTGKGAGEFLYIFDFSESGYRPTILNVQDRLEPALDAAGQVTGRASILYSVDGITYQPIRSLAGHVDRDYKSSVTTPLALPANTDKVYYKVVIAPPEKQSSGGALAQWGRAAAGQKSFEVDFAVTRFEKAAPTESSPLLKDDVTVHLKPGRNRLIDAGMYRMGCQPIGQPPRYFPAGWSAITFNNVEVPEGVISASNPWGQQNGRDTLLLHPPYRVDGGISFVEYDLALPAGLSAEFRTGFATAIGKAAKSDGITYRVKLIDAGKTKVLADQNWDSETWKDFACDLTPYAGRTITLRLETDPGPASNTAWDYALFADPTIFVGVAADKAPSFRSALIASDKPEYSNVAQCSNVNTDGLRPTTVGHFSNSYQLRGDIAEFHYKGDDGQLVYRWDTTKAFLSAVMVSYRGEDFEACRHSGIDVIDGEVPTRERISVKQTEYGVEVIERYKTSHHTAQLTTCVAIRGRSLVIETSSPDHTIGSVFFGGLHGIEWMTKLDVPYLTVKQLAYLHKTKSFLSFFTDWTESHASQYFFRRMSYLPLTDGSYNAVRERAFLTVAPRIVEVLPNIPNPPSPFLEDLSTRIVVDLWRGKFADQAAWTRELASYGVKNLFIIKHIWQREGLDEAFPTVTPANKFLGGDAGLRDFGLTCRELGYRFSLHENYVDVYDNSDDYSPADLALDSKGKHRPAWKNDHGHQSYNMKPTSMVNAAARWSPDVHNRYETSGSFLDVHASTAPWERPFDMQAGMPLAGMFRSTWLTNSALFQFERATHKGPVFSEGGLGHFTWSGLIDGVEGALAGGETRPLLVDFELLKVKPLVLNRGMGYLERWLATGYDGMEWHHFPGTSAQRDKYRASEIAYGHLGMIMTQTFRLLPQAVREYYLVSPVTARSSLAKPECIEYEVDGKLVSANVVVLLGGSDRLHIRYDNGLDIWVNVSSQIWSVAGQVIPPNGYFASAPGFVSGTTLRDGLVVDYRASDGIYYADARSFNENTAAARHAVAEVSIPQPKVIDARKFEITYRFKVLETPVYPGNIRVEYVRDNQVVFSHYHRPRVPMEQWKPGDDIVDGPYVLTVPEKAPTGDYIIRIGLQNAPNVETDLAGYRYYDTENYWYNLPTFQVTNNDLSITMPPAVQSSVLPSGYRRINSDRRMVDFGPIVTADAVVLENQATKATLIPVPADSPAVAGIRTARLSASWKPAGTECEAFDKDGKSLGSVPVSIEGDQLKVVMKTPGARSYVLKRPNP